MKPKYRILIVDDEEPIRFAIAMVLKMQGYCVETIDNGESALHRIMERHYSDSPFDLIICDIQIPRLTGEELIEKLIDLKIRLPIIVITGYGDKELLVRLLRLGCRDFIDKPFDPQELENRVKAVLNVKSREAIEKYRFDRLNALGDKTNALLHDLNNMVQCSVGYAGVLKNKTGLPDPFQKNMEKMVASVEIAADIGRKLMLLRSSDSAKIKTKNEIRVIVHRISEILRSIVPDTVEIKTAVPDHPVWQSVNPERIQQAVLNLGMNSLDAMPNGGVIVLSLTELCAGRTPDSPEMNCVCLSVEDTGTGISEKRQKDLFVNPFTTKDNGHGHGLFIVKEIITEHDGWIEYKNKPEKGATFRLFLPTSINGQTHKP